MNKTDQKRNTQRSVQDAQRKLKYQGKEKQIQDVNALKQAYSETEKKQLEILKALENYIVKAQDITKAKWLLAGLEIARSKINASIKIADEKIEAGVKMNQKTSKVSREEKKAIKATFKEIDKIQKQQKAHYMKISKEYKKEKVFIGESLHNSELIIMGVVRNVLSDEMGVKAIPNIMSKYQIYSATR